MSTPELVYIKKEISDLAADISEIKATQSKYIEEHHNLEKSIVEMRSDLAHIKSSQDSLNTNITKLLFIIGGGFIVAFVGWVIKGGLS
jgi:chromosome segregation ATPase|tara:strand:- start:1318 stop:1581 length:264 start_codon:yes stop_codon:yes gene_type:complete